MRIAVVDVYYPAFLDAFYAARPGLADGSYETQRATLMDAWFGTADSYSWHFRALGHEAIDVVANAEPLQWAWAAERNGRRSAIRLASSLPGRSGIAARRELTRQVALRQIDDSDADVVYSHNLGFFRRGQLERLRGQDRLVVGQIASPLPAERLVAGFDLIVSSFPHYVDRLRAEGMDAEYQPLAADERVLERLRADGVDPSPDAQRSYDVVFVGGVHPGVHGKGTRLLELLCAARPIDVWGYGAESLPPDSPILRRYHGEAWGLDMYRALAGARVAVNRHIDAAEGYANNMRLYEATAMGAALVTDAGRNLHELFDPGREVVTYSDPDELVARIDDLLANDERRLAIARSGQARTLSEHTFASRMAELADILERRLARMRR